jgi:hypothetical protein
LNPAIVIGLRSMGYIDGDGLSLDGDELCRVALMAMMVRMRKNLKLGDQVPHRR